MTNIEIREKWAFAIVSLLLIATYLSIYIDLNIFRPVLSTISFLFIPGAALLLWMDGENRIIRHFHLSVPLSVFLLFFVGFIASFGGNLVGISRPLEPNFLLYVYSILHFSLLYSSLGLSDKLYTYQIKTKRYKQTLIFIFILIFLISISINLMGTLDSIPSRSILILVYLTYALIILFIIYFKVLPESGNAIYLWIIGIGIMLPYSLQSDFIIGTDIYQEFWMFKQISIRSRWVVLADDDLISGTLSSTLLSVVLNNLTGIDPHVIFKLLIPSIFSTAVVSIYSIAKNFLSEELAKVSALLFICTTGYLQSPSLHRSIISILFGVSFLYVLFNYRKCKTQRLLLIMFTFGVVATHYTTSIIFGVNLSIFFIFHSIYLISKNEYRKSPSNWEILVLFWVSFLAWQVFVSYAALVGGITIFVRFMDSLLTPSTSQGGQTTQEVNSLLGNRLPELSLAEYLEFLNIWVIIALIFAGLVYYFYDSITNRERIPIEFKIFSGSFAVLLASYLIPIISRSYGRVRLTLFTFSLLTIAFSSGSLVVSGALQRVSSKPQKWTKIVLGLIIVIFLLTNLGVTYHLLGDGTGATLSSQDDDYYHWNIVQQSESDSAKWIYRYKQDGYIYTDRGPRHNKIKIAKTPSSDRYEHYQEGIIQLSPEKELIRDRYVYLHSPNVNHKLIALNKTQFEHSDYIINISMENEKIYANNRSEILKT